jgi:putative SOS response-associated peptidase YedK
MFKLYSNTKGPDTIGGIVDRLECWRDLGFAPLPAVLPGQAAPVISRDADGRRSIEYMRWGFPPLPYWPCRGTVLTVRTPGSAYWRQWSRTGNRCLVPATAFCEQQDGSTVPTWFARPPGRDDVRPLFFFAGLWRSWKGTQGSGGEPVDGEQRLFSFLTVGPDDAAGRAEARTMPVILTTTGEIDQWLDGTQEEALTLQHPAPDDLLTVVSRGPLQDCA